jgi:hypothetical protein
MTLSGMPADDLATMGGPSVGRQEADAATSSAPGRYEAFISYARDDSKFVIGWLRAALAAWGHLAVTSIAFPAGILTECAGGR